MKNKVVKNTIAIGLLVLSQWCYSNTELTLTWYEDILTIHGKHLPSGVIEIRYMEAFCRPNSQKTDWLETMIGHQTKLLSASKDGKNIVLESTLDDGVMVTHNISVEGDAVSFDIVANNPTEQRSEAHWAQPCIRLENFTGLGQEDYINRSFIFMDDTLTLLSDLSQWSTEARYIPGQVWRHPEVSPDDVNPRPLSDLLPSNGLIGCLSKDDKMLFATAWEPWQELFQGVIVCLHSDFRIGGLEPKESKNIKGKIYIMNNDVDALLKRYSEDFLND